MLNEHHLSARGNMSLTCFMDSSMDVTGDRAFRLGLQSDKLIYIYIPTYVRVC